MAQVLAAVVSEGLEPVLVAVELALESGNITGDHVLNVLARLQSPVVALTPQGKLLLPKAIAFLEHAEELAELFAGEPRVREVHVVASQYLIAYALISMKKVEGDSVLYQGMNIAAGILLIVNTLYLQAYPSAGLNVAWVGIGLFTLGRKWLSRD